jgi:hypothetical protein
MAKLKSEKLQIYIDPELRGLLLRRAKDENISASKLAVRAIALYLTKDIEDESLLIAKMTELQRAVGYIDRKIDIAQKKDMQWEQYLLAFQPELPADKETRESKIKRAGTRYARFICQFRDKAKALPSLMEAVTAGLNEGKDPRAGGEP